MGRLTFLCPTALTGVPQVHGAGLMQALWLPRGALAVQWARALSPILPIAGCYHRPPASRRCLRCPRVSAHRTRSYLPGPHPHARQHCHPALMNAQPFLHRFTPVARHVALLSCFSSNRSAFVRSGYASNPQTLTRSPSLEGHSSAALARLALVDFAAGAQVARPRRERPPRDGGAGAWRRSGL